jgi:hypothetical protein
MCGPALRGNPLSAIIWIMQTTFGTSNALFERQKNDDCISPIFFEAISWLSTLIHRTSYDAVRILHEEPPDDPTDGTGTPSKPKWPRRPGLFNANKYASSRSYWRHTLTSCVERLSRRIGKPIQRLTTLEC